MTDKLFVEPRANGGFKVIKSDAARASAVAPTQAKAIEAAKKLNPDATVHVARVRNVGPGPNKYRT